MILSLPGRRHRERPKIKRRSLWLGPLLLVLLAAGLVLGGRGLGHKQQPTGLFTTLPILWNETADVAGLIKADQAPHWARAELAARGATRLVLAGASTNWCIRATAYAALERGYDLTLVQDAHSTKSMDLGDGRRVAARAPAAATRALRAARVAAARLLRPQPGTECACGKEEVALLQRLSGI